MNLLKVGEFLKTAESVGLQPCNLLFSDYKNFALASTRVYDGTGKGIPNTENRYTFDIGNVELKATQKEARMYEYWLTLNGDKGPAYCVEVSPGYGISQLKGICNKYGIPVPQEMVAMLQALGIRN